MLEVERQRFPSLDLVPTNLQLYSTGCESNEQRVADEVRQIQDRLKELGALAPIVKLPQKLIAGTAAEWLQVVWSEWVASDWREDRVTNDLDLKQYETAMARAKRQGESRGHDKLAANIWNWSSELSTCTNGGWDAWVCPFGWHLIPFTVEVE